MEKLQSSLAQQNTYCSSLLKCTLIFRVLISATSVGSQCENAFSFTGVLQYVYQGKDEVTGDLKRA